MKGNESLAIWLGRGLSGIVIAFMLFDASIKLVPMDVAVKATSELGFTANLSLMRGLGLLGVFCTALYALPRTSLLGAVLLTGFCGGAVAAHLRTGSPFFSHVLFGVYVGAMAWAGLYLRDARIRALFPLRRD